MVAKLFLSGPVGDYDYEGNGIFFSQVYDFFEWNKDATGYEIMIDSPGGYADEGYKIASYIEMMAQSKPVTTVAIGCASIATVIFLAGSTRLYMPGLKFMIHNPWTSATGNAQHLEDVAEFLREEEDKLINHYAARTKARKNTLRRLMKEEYYFSEQELIELGFAQGAYEAVLAYERKPHFRAVAMIHENNSETIEMMDNTIKQKVLAALDDVFGAKALEIALANGQTAKIQTKEASAQIGDSIALLVDGKRQNIENGQYETADSEKILVVESGKIADILNKVETQPEVLNLEAVTDMIAGVAEKFKAELKAALEPFKAENEALQNQVAAMQTKLEEANALNAKVKESFEAIRAELQETQTELDETKRGVSSTYTVKHKTELETGKESDGKVLNLEGIELMSFDKLRKEQSKNKQIRSRRQKIGLGQS